MLLNRSGCFAASEAAILPCSYSLNAAREAFGTVRFSLRDLQSRSRALSILTSLHFQTVALALSCPLPWMTSGAMYSMVPIRLLLRPPSARPAFASPKSVIRMCPSLSSSKFSCRPAALAGEDSLATQWQSVLNLG